MPTISKYVTEIIDELNEYYDINETGAWINQIGVEIADYDHVIFKCESNYDIEHIRNELGLTINECIDQIHDILGRERVLFVEHNSSLYYAIYITGDISPVNLTLLLSKFPDKIDVSEKLVKCGYMFNWNVEKNVASMRFMGKTPLISTQNDLVVDSSEEESC